MLLWVFLVNYLGVLTLATQGMSNVQHAELKCLLLRIWVLGMKLLCSQKNALDVMRAVNSHANNAAIAIPPANVENRYGAKLVIFRDGKIPDNNLLSLKT